METKRVVNSLLTTAKDSIQSESYYSAFAILLMIPEIINKNVGKEEYIYWCNNYIKTIDGFDGEVLYKFKQELFFGINKGNSYTSNNIKIYPAQNDTVRFLFDTKDNNRNWVTYSTDIHKFFNNMISCIEKTFELVAA